MYELYYMENGRKVPYIGSYTDKQANRIIKCDRVCRNRYTFKEPIKED